MADTAASHDDDDWVVETCGTGTEATGVGRAPTKDAGSAPGPRVGRHWLLATGLVLVLAAVGFVTVGESALIRLIWGGRRRRASRHRGETRPMRRPAPVGGPGTTGARRAPGAPLVVLAAALVTVVAAATVVAPSAGHGGPTAAGAAAPGPAFTTAQAPGGATTAGQRVIALTFDDGPGPYTPQVLSVLQQLHVPATFFEIGEHVAQYPQDTKLVAEAGDPVEDHTWSHPDLTTIPVSQFAVQIDQTQQEIASVTGTTPTCVRPPYDDWNATVLQQIAQRGLTTMSYSVDPRDWSMPGVQTIVDRVLGAAFPGAVVDLHDGGGDRSQTVAALPQIVSGLRAQGYSFVSICGAAPPPPQTSAVTAFGAAPAAGAPVTSAVPFSAAAAGGGGYWLAAEDGGVFSFDGAGFEGSLPGLGVTPARPVVAMAATPDGRGYWLVAADGGVFAFGDAAYLGSMAGQPLSQPVVAMAATPDGRGYWLVGADGGVFAFGDAAYLGSMAGQPLSQPVVAMAGDPATGGYWLLGRDGGLFGFGAPFDGSLGGQDTGNAFFAMAVAAGGAGYWLAGQHPASG